MIDNLTIATLIADTLVDGEAPDDLLPGEDEFLSKAAELSGDYAETLDVYSLLQFGTIIAKMSEWVGENFTYNNKENS